MTKEPQKPGEFLYRNLKPTMPIPLTGKQNLLLKLSRGKSDTNQDTARSFHPCSTQLMLAGPKMDPLPAKARPISNSGTIFKKGKKWLCSRSQRETTPPMSVKKRVEVLQTLDQRFPCKLC